MEKGNKISAIGYFGGYNMKGNFDIQVKATFMEPELKDALQFLAGIGKRLKLAAKIGDETIKLGSFNVFSLKVDRDAQCTVTFKSNQEYVKVENLSKLSVEDATINFMAIVTDEE